MIHIGEKIEEVFKKSGLTKVAFAKKINKGRENIYDVFKRESIDTDLLDAIGKALNHNFFEYFIDNKMILNEPPQEIYRMEKKKTRILVELELEEDEIIKMGLKDKIIQTLK